MGRDPIVQKFGLAYNRTDAINGFPLILVVDDSEFVARNLNNFLWTTFTRSDPAADTYGIDSIVHNKHWGCLGSLVIDARAKAQHAPPLIEDPEVTRSVDDWRPKASRFTGLSKCRRGS
jgi:4-hydroxy-3-polyprenylbenzoate decarboxylase